MGTAYKGNSKTYRSIEQNILIVSEKYPCINGRFGISSPSTGQRTRNISSPNPLETAIDFYNKISFGGIEKRLKGGALKITRMADGCVVTFRTYSHSDGTPVIEINISDSTHTGGIKGQKIHFIVEEN